MKILLKKLRENLNLKRYLNNFTITLWIFKSNIYIINMVLNEKKLDILDMKSGSGYVSGDYIQDNRIIKIIYGPGQGYTFNLSSDKYEDGNNLITLYETNKEYAIDMPVLMIRFNNPEKAKSFHEKIYNEYNKNPQNPSPAAGGGVALNHKKRKKKRKKSKKRNKSKRRKKSKKHSKKK